MAEEGASGNSNAGTSAELRQAKDRLAAEHSRIAELVSSRLAGSAKSFDIVLADGTHAGAVSAADYAFRFPRLVWTVAAFDPANGGLGATQSNFQSGNWVGAATRILPDGLVRFEAWGDMGLDYLLLHETAHTTPLGVAMNADCYAHRNPHVAWGPDDPQWVKNEKVANTIARVVAQELGVPWFPSAGAGYRVRESELLAALAALG